MKSTNTTLLLASELITMVKKNQFEHDIELVNGHAGILPISVAPELYTLIAKSIRLYELTGGEFNIFEKSEVDYIAVNEIEINPLLLSVYLPHSGLRIDLGKIISFGQA